MLRKILLVITFVLLGQTNLSYAGSTGNEELSGSNKANTANEKKLESDLSKNIINYFKLNILIRFCSKISESNLR